MSYSISLGEWNSVFAVPCSVVDRELKLAGSVQLKVLLWVLRRAGSACEPQEIAGALCLDKADVADALLYWREKGFLSENGQTEEPIVPKTEEPATPPQAEPPQIPPAAQDVPKHHVLSRPQKPDAAFCAQRMEESQEVACLMQSAQDILGRLISGGETATLLMIHDEFGLPSDVIIMMLQFAAGIGRGNMRYIEKMAASWADEGIDSHEKAEEKLRRLAENQKAWRMVEEAVGMPRRQPSAREEAFADCWVREWKFSADMIREAYDRGVDSTGKFTAGYMNKILERWQKSGITTLRQAQQENAERAASRKPGAKRELTFDIDEYERTSINDAKG